VSTTRKTTCDLCGIPKPEDYKLQKGWAYVTVDGSAGQSRDFCKTCWVPVERILLRSFVDGLMLEAQGIKEDS
jgi:hypothetical protein